MFIPNLSRYHSIEELPNILPLLDIPRFGIEPLNQVIQLVRNREPLSNILPPTGLTNINFALVKTTNTLSYFMYEINGVYYYVLNLNVVDPNTILNVRHSTNINLETLTSKLVLLVLNDGGILLTSDGNELRILDSYSDSTSPLDQPIRKIAHLQIPQSYNSSRIIPRNNAPDFNNNLIEPLVLELRTTNPTYNEIFANTNSIIMNGLRVNFISFEEISNMLIQNKIERYIIDPSLQYLTTNPNVILTMFGRNGLTYLVKARYDQVSNQIFPPI